MEGLKAVTDFSDEVSLRWKRRYIHSFEYFMIGRVISFGVPNIQPALKAFVYRRDAFSME